MHPSSSATTTMGLNDPDYNNTNQPQFNQGLNNPYSQKIQNLIPQATPVQNCWGTGDRGVMWRCAYDDEGLHWDAYGFQYLLDLLLGNHMSMVDSSGPMWSQPGLLTNNNVEWSMTSIWGRWYTGSE
ncbi:hypothetical protein L218DRAFT_944119 [Marasmius fiardii PR-910]|nr:hypothetical protein L218DRAFT_944119 [Marasmius fiardii PR-910]